MPTYVSHIVVSVRLAGGEIQGSWENKHKEKRESIQ